MYSIRSSANSDSFTSFPIWIPFLSFSSLIAVAKNSKAMLNSSGESKHSFFLPEFSGKALSFSLLSMMLAVFNSFYYVGICSLYTCFDESFIMNVC